jgi:magnesium-transporting ATPase (P-type)
MENQLIIIGALLIVLALVHIFFPRYFHWKEDLKSMSLINRQVMQVHTFFIAFIVLLIGLLCIIHAQSMLSTKIGRDIALGLAVFWGVRFLFQQFVYSKKLWRGKVFETIVHIVFSFLWIYFTLVFSFVFLGKSLT